MAKRFLDLTSDCFMIIIMWKKYFVQLKIEAVFLMVVKIVIKFSGIFIKSLFKKTLKLFTYFNC